MVFVRRTYSEARGAAARFWTVALAGAGVLLILFGRSSHLPRAIEAGQGIAHADAPQQYIDTSCDSFNSCDGFDSGAPGDSCGDSCGDGCGSGS